MRDNFDLYSWNKKRYLKEGLKVDDTNALLKYLDIDGEFPWKLSFGDDEKLNDIIKQLKSLGIDAEWDDYMDVS